MVWRKKDAAKSQAKALRANLDKNHDRLESGNKPQPSQSTTRHKANAKMFAAIQLQCRLHDEATKDAAIRTRLDEVISDMAPTYHHQKYTAQIQWILDKDISMETLQGCIKTKNLPPGWEATQAGPQRNASLSNSTRLEQPVGQVIQTSAGRPKFGAFGAHLPNTFPTPSTTTASKRKKWQVDDDEDDEEVPAQRIKVASPESPADIQQQTVEGANTSNNRDRNSARVENAPASAEPAKAYQTIKVEEKEVEIVDISDENDRARSRADRIMAERPHYAVAPRPEPSAKEKSELIKQRLEEIEIQDQIDKRALEKMRLLREQQKLDRLRDQGGR